MGKSIGNDLAKINVFILITKILNRLKPKEVFETKIRVCMGRKFTSKVMINVDKLEYVMFSA